MQSTTIESNNLGFLFFYYDGGFYIYKSFLILNSLLGKCKVPSPPHGSTIAFQIESCKRFEHWPNVFSP